MENNTSQAMLDREQNEFQRLWTLGQMKDNGQLQMDWNQIADLMNREFREDDLHYYGESVYRKNYTTAKKFYEAGVFDAADDDKYLGTLQSQHRNIEKEKIKVQTEKLEYNRWLREEARDELITEKLVRAIASLPPLKLPELIPAQHTDRDYCLVLADAHYGIEFELKDLWGETLNEYSPEIFEYRMWNLLSQVKEIIQEQKVDHLRVWELGDSIQGILRLNSQLLKLRYGVLEASVLYANFLANWLNELSKYVTIEFQMVMDSNHNQLRLCGAPKNAFKEENMSRIMMVLIKERLKDNPNIKIVENPTGMNFAMMCGYTVLGVHGEVKDLSQAINEFARAYQCPLDYIIGAHNHHTSDKETGRCSEALSVRSLMGVDPYGLSLNKTSDAGASLFVFERYKGLVCEYRLKFNWIERNL